MPMPHPIALICIALLCVLLFALGLTVSLTRLRSKVLIGGTPDPDAMLSRVIRAHGNTAEYAPLLALMMLILGALAPSSLALAAHALSAVL